MGRVRSGLVVVFKGVKFYCGLKFLEIMVIEMFFWWENDYKIICEFLCFFNFVLCVFIIYLKVYEFFKKRFVYFYI